MDLKTFVSESLHEIVAGVAEGNRLMKAVGGAANPEISGHNGAASKMLMSLGGSPVLMVSFDVAVNAESTAGAKGGIGVFFGAVGIGSQADAKSVSDVATRLKFEVPIVLPRGI